MKLKKFIAIGSAVVLAALAMVSVGLGGKAQAAGTTLYWCEFAGNGNFYNNVTPNWDTAADCSSGTQVYQPASGDALVFDNTHLGSSIAVTNNLSGLDLASITFTGSTTDDYILNGNAISLDSGITDSTTAGSVVNDIVNLGVNLTANQTIDISSGTNNNLVIEGSLGLGSNNLSLSSNPNALIKLYTVTGSGSLTFNGASGSNINFYQLYSSNTSFTGSVNIASNANVSDLSNNANALGTGLITVASGGSLEISSTTSSNLTLANSLNLAGSGDGIDDYGALISCLGASSCTDAASTLTLSGNVTLSGNAKLVNGAYIGSTAPANTATFTLSASCITTNGYALSGVSGSNTQVNQPAVCTSSSSSTKLPGAPNTGYGVISKDSSLIAIGITLIAGALTLVIATLSKKHRSSTPAAKR